MLSKVEAMGALVGEFGGFDPLFCFALGVSVTAAGVVVVSSSVDPFPPKSQNSKLKFECGNKMNLNKDQTLKVCAEEVMMKTKV